jgi:hypothetical protein
MRARDLSALDDAYAEDMRESARRREGRIESEKRRAKVELERKQNKRRKLELEREKTRRDAQRDTLTHT